MNVLERVFSVTSRRQHPDARAPAAPEIWRGDAHVPSGHEIVCRLVDIPDGGVIGIDLRRESPLPLILWRRGQTVDAWLNCCPADGYRMDWAPGRFLIEGAVLRCAHRNARFALDQAGLGIEGPCRGQSLVAVPTRVEAGFVTLTEPASVVVPESH